MVADSAKVYLVEDGGSAVLHVSPAAFPHVVHDMVEKAHEARQALGANLGQVIPTPIAQWQHNGISCALFEVLRPISTSPLRRRLQMRTITPRVLTWLRGVAELDRGRSNNPELPLQALTACPHDRLQRAASDSLKRVEVGAFAPRSRIMHGDLWSGNILLDPTRQRQFTVIDWRGSSLDGFPIFDLIKFAESARLSPTTLRVELQAHAERLDCEIGDTRTYLVAGLGLIWLNLDQFPPERFAAMATRNLQIVEAALNE